MRHVRRRRINLTKPKIKLNKHGGLMELNRRQKMKRRDFFKTAAIGSATLVSLPAMVDAVADSGSTRPSLDGSPANKFTILLAGLYKPVVHCPDLGLSTVNVCDGTYSVNKIYPVNGLTLDDGGEDSSRSTGLDCQAPIGKFYVQFAAHNGHQYCAYDLPGGTLAMEFTGGSLAPVPDTQGGTYLIGVPLLVITEGTGAYQSFVGGHNTTVDILRHLSDGTFVEHCFCNISRP
jgi:hypothetical protein